MHSPLASMGCGGTAWAGVFR